MKSHRCNLDLGVEILNFKSCEIIDYSTVLLQDKYLAIFLKLKYNDCSIRISN